MLQKIHALQKRLIKKTEEVKTKESEVKQKEKRIEQLKVVLARHPGPETADAIEMYKQNLDDKGKQMKAMQAELTTYNRQVGEYKYEIERLNLELQEIKVKYYKQKKREQLLKEANKTEPRVKYQMPAVPRFTGGGFSLAI
eukprot:TRINITY_DN1223_c0_g1_i6.p1 TRINITY_DN1223_c0_g1~~TRINITY_DN1223_c0_g1_i6.p1  ORF type:complete len:141 (+),score=72.08 TRINITY_DN1223_c0_g1_i6:184-606(+)